MMWYGTLPDRWSEKKVSDVFSERKVKVSYKDFAALSVSKGGIVPQIATVAKSNDGDNRKKVCKGDFVINSRSDRRGSSGVSNYDGSVSLINIVLTPRHYENARYWHYLLKSHSFLEGYYCNGRGIVADLWTTRYSEMKTIYLPVPPREEQDQIVRFLDWKVLQVGKLMNAKKKEIALLKEQKQVLINTAVTRGLNANAEMKDSGIDWVGQIPAHWSVETIKQHFEIHKDIAGKEGYEVLSITQKGLKTKDITSNEGQMAQSYANYQFVRIGDFAMNHMDLLTGYVDFSTQFGVTSPDYRVFSFINPDNHCPRYFLRVFQNCYHRKIFYGFGQGAADKGRWRLPKGNFYGFQIPIPPKKEQEQIADHLDNLCDRIDELTAKVESELAVITEYRTRLISDVVTGKIDVRGIAVHDFEAVDEAALEDEVTEDSDTEEVENDAD